MRALERLGICAGLSEPSLLADAISTKILCAGPDIIVICQSQYVIYVSMIESTVKSVLGCCQAHRCLPVGFLLLRYSVLCTIESLSLLYLLFIA